MANRKATIADIAGALDLSPATVSFVLNNRDMGISEETKTRVWDTARKLGYQKMSRGNAGNWTRVGYLTNNIGFFNFHTSFFANVFFQLQRKSSSAFLECFLLEYNPNESADSRYQNLQKIQAQEIDIFLTNNGQIASQLIDAGLKVILIQAGSQEKRCVSIYCDDYSAGRIAAAHAWDMGHRKAGLIFPDSCSRNPRFNGFLTEFRQLGGVCEERFHWFVKFDHERAEYEVAAFVEEFKDDLPTLFYCFADNTMFPAIRGIVKCGLKVPDDISLIGTDNLYWGRLTAPAFSTVDLCEELFAEKVIEAIAHVKKGGEPYCLAVPVRMVPRETVKDLS